MQYDRYFCDKSPFFFLKDVLGWYFNIVVTYIGTWSRQSQPWDPRYISVSLTYLFAEGGLYGLTNVMLRKCLAQSLVH